MKLEDYQIEGVKFLANNYHAYLGDDMGLGKTAQVIKSCEKLKSSNILVICPASVKFHWGNEFDKWGLGYKYDIVEGGKYQLNKHITLTIVNYELLLVEKIFKQLKARRWDVLVCDEAHFLKTLTSQRSAKVLGRGGIAHNARYKWMLSGSPIENRPVDLFPVLYTLGSHVLGDYNTYEKFVMRYCDGYYDFYTGEPTPNGASNEAELGSRLKNFMLRRTLKDKLPETITQVIPLEKNVKLLELEKQLSGDDEQNFFFKPMAELGALASLRQETSLAKLPQCIQYIKDVLGVVDKLVVFAYHRSVINNLAEALKQFNPVKYYGGMNINQKEEAKKKFKHGKNCKVFIGQLDAAGTGVDGLQEVCSCMIFVEIDWTPFRQCIGRLVRKGQKSKNVIVQIVICKGSIEERIYKSVNSKLKSIDKIMGG